MGIFNKAGVKPQRFVKELAVESVDGYELGQEIKVDVLAEVGYVDITGTSKGKGTSGVMKRHGFGGNRACLLYTSYYQTSMDIFYSSIKSNILYGVV